jgi:hypothetical protein
MHVTIWVTKATWVDAARSRVPDHADATLLHVISEEHPPPDTARSPPADSAGRRSPWNATAGLIPFGRHRAIG